MQRSRRVMRASLVLVILLLLLLPLATPVAAVTRSSPWRVPGPATKLYVGQATRLTAQIPAFWTASTRATYDYVGPDGFVRSVPLAASSLNQACAQSRAIAPDATMHITQWRGEPACIVTVPAAGSNPAMMALVVAHPHPFTIFGTEVRYVALIADPVHFPAITATLSFDPGRVTPLAYVLSVFDSAQARTLYRDGVDWTWLRQSTQRTVTDWFTAHDQIQLLISMLRAAGDNHSMLLSPAESANMDAIRQEPPTGQRFGGDIGYLQLPGVWADPVTSARYLQAARSIVTGIEQSPTCGWIVDLRRNNGGDVYPMIQAVSPLLGDGRIFGFRYPDGSQDWISLRNGAVLANGVEFMPATGEGVASPDLGESPVAVLIGPRTASSGELTAIAFIGRPMTRLFGAPTGGYTTGNMAYALFDGYTLLLAGTYDTDRTGRVYEHGVTPDETITATGEFGTENDPAVRAAMDWLAQQPACQAPHVKATSAA